VIRPGPGARVAAAVLVALAAAGAWWSVTYNRLVQARLAVDAQWAQVETQYQRRIDLVPQLTAAVRAALGQEQAVFGELARARQAYLLAPPGSPDRVRAAAQVERPLAGLIAVIEAYPNLRSAESVARLMDELSGTENRIAVERRRYNERVQVYDTLVQQFPASLVASAGHFALRPYFTAAPPAAAPPAVTLPR
jgi:LemA protein